MLAHSKSSADVLCGAGPFWVHAKRQYSGIVVPQINTAEDAKAVVANAKFPPYGLRGQGSPFPGIAHNIDVSTYIKTANETVLICLQIESKEGVKNVDAICAVSGVGECFNTDCDVQN
jgi:4-hydroxy-2-oxoheptanedioate aldolase